jgi:5-methylcytosine-specific restriction endonuclease McrA
LQSKCRQCRSDERKARYAANKTKERTGHKEYYQANREQVLAQQREYAQSHAEAKSQRASRYYQENTDAIKARIKDYAHNNRQVVNQHKKAYYDRKRHAQGSHTRQEWEALKEACNYSCVCCGKREPEIQLTPDHVVPFSKGGSNDISNIQPLCISCNSSKAAKIIDYRKG